MALIECPNPECGIRFRDDPSRHQCPMCGQPLDRFSDPGGVTSKAGGTDSGERTAGAGGTSPAAAGTDPLRDRRRRPRAAPQRSLHADLRELVDAYEQERPIISVIGFEDSGKTFLINRLRDDLGDRHWRCDPPPERGEIPHTPAGLELSRFAPEQGAPHWRTGVNYVVTDCAGESFRLGTDSRAVSGENLRPFLAAIGLASAYILVIKAAEVIHPDMIGDETAKRLLRAFDRFYDILSCILVASDRLTEQSAATFLMQGVTSRELKEAFDVTDFRTRRPIAVVFSQADQMESRPALSPADYDEDPALFVLRRFPQFFNRIHGFFDYYRFDFMSAFHGQTSSAVPDYQLPSFGALEAFDWIHSHLARQEGWRNDFYRLRHGFLPSRWAARLRRWTDSEFRRFWDQREGARL